MRLQSLTISQYKNLEDFTLNFDGAIFIDVFVGKNGTGKSNPFEALIEIFRHLYDYDKDKANINFDDAIKYEIGDEYTAITWNAPKLTLGKLQIDHRCEKATAQASMQAEIINPLFSNMLPGTYGAEEINLKGSVLFAHLYGEIWCEGTGKSRMKKVESAPPAYSNLHFSTWQRGMSVSMKRATKKTKPSCVSLP